MIDTISFRELYDFCSKQNVALAFKVPEGSYLLLRLTVSDLETDQEMTTTISVDPEDYQVPFAPMDNLERDILDYIKWWVEQNKT